VLLMEVPYIGRKVRDVATLSAGAAVGTMVPNLIRGDTVGIVGAVLGAVVFFASAVGGACWWHRRRARRLFDSSGGRLCTKCAYSLVGLKPEGECPECAEPYVISRNIRAWAACAGF